MFIAMKKPNAMEFKWHKKPAAITKPPPDEDPQASVLQYSATGVFVERLSDFETAEIYVTSEEAVIYEMIRDFVCKAKKVVKAENAVITAMRDGPLADQFAYLRFDSTRTVNFAMDYLVSELSFGYTTELVEEARRLRFGEG